VYFVANGVLDQTAASEGAIQGDCEPSGEPGGTGCNLYAIHHSESGWEPPRLVAVLSTQDYSDWGSLATADLAKVTSRASPDGQWLAFMSQQSLTGYDNHDALSGEPDQEVFLYHASAGAQGTLLCASCDPSGARPHGAEYANIKAGLVGDDEKTWRDDQWLAATLPGWTPYSLGKALYQSRYLSDTGRLFFNSSDALVSSDVNGNWDVYEYEPPGVGSCAEASHAFVSSSRGCLGLVSSGRAAGESAFIDASETGDDVFFLTGAKLVRGDVDTALDLYDAHVCSESAPCSSETASPPPCVTVDSCRPAPAPQPAVFGAPASATFSGEGNVASQLSSPPTGIPRPTALTRAQRLARALAACRKRRNERRRAVCERRARRAYGAVASKVVGAGKRGRRG
jgi:hypothetical protein